MQQETKKTDEICLVETSGKGDLCALFALANCIAFQDANTRREAYDRMGLTNEKAGAMLDKLMGEFETRYKKIKSMNVTIDMILEYKKKVLGDSFTKVDEEKIKLEFLDSSIKTQMIEDYKDFLFCQKRDDVPDFTSHDFQTTIRCLYNLEEFAELLELKNQSEEATEGKSFLDILDSSTKLHLVGRKKQTYEHGTKELLAYKPSCYEKFIGLAIKEKRKEWREEENSLIRNKLLDNIADMPITLLRTIMKTDYGSDDDDKLSRDSLEFLISKILPDYPLTKDIFDLSQETKCLRISLYSGHFIAHAKKSEIEKSILETPSKTTESKTNSSQSIPRISNTHTAQREEAIEKNKNNNILAGVLIYGALGFGATLLCASALGLGVVSAPVLGVAVAVGVGTAIVGSAVINPVVKKIFVQEGKKVEEVAK
jgi:hypothetical protein